MKAKIIIQTKDKLLIEWKKQHVGFGQLSLIWDKESSRYILDAEMMGIDHVIEVFQTIGETKGEDRPVKRDFRDEVEDPREYV